MKSKRILIFVVAYNHEQFIENVLSRIPLELSKYDTIILAVAHREFLEMNLEDLKKGEALIYDVKGILPKTVSDKRL